MSRQISEHKGALTRADLRKNDGVTLDTVDGMKAEDFFFFFLDETYHTGVAYWTSGEEKNPRETGALTRRSMELRLFPYVKKDNLHAYEKIVNMNPLMKFSAKTEEEMVEDVNNAYICGSSEYAFKEGGLKYSDSMMDLGVLADNPKQCVNVCNANELCESFMFSAKGGDCDLYQLSEPEAGKERMDYVFCKKKIGASLKQNKSFLNPHIS